MRLTFWLFLVASLIGGSTQACTTFCFYNGSGLVFGKNYDWRTDVGLVVVNQPGLTKFGTSQINKPRWNSQYGSVTFNQYGVEWPSGGMNTAGLVIELSWLNETEYATNEGDARDRLGTLSWIQYQLDTAATIDDVVSSDSQVKISPGSGAKVHYLACEATGECASIEFLDGEMIIHRQQDLPWQVLTNHSYEQSQHYAQPFMSVKSSLNAKPGKGSLDRFVRAALAEEHAKQLSTIDLVSYAFETLDNVKQGTYTQWQIVYDVKTMTVYWRTRAAPELKILPFDDLVFGCGSGTKVVDVNSTAAGLMLSELTAFSVEKNLELINDSYSATPFLANVPQNNLLSMAKFHGYFECS